MRYPYIIPGHQYQEQSNLASLPFIKSQSQDEPLDLKELIKYCLMPVPPSSLGTPYGFFSMTNKATILQYLLEDTTPEDLPYPKDEFFIQDGMELLHIRLISLIQFSTSNFKVQCSFVFQVEVCRSLQSTATRKRLAQGWCCNSITLPLLVTRMRWSEPQTQISS